MKKANYSDLEASVHIVGVSYLYGIISPDVQPVLYQTISLRAHTLYRGDPVYVLHHW